MEAEFMVELRARDFTVETVGVLEAENISSKHVFTCLHKEHSSGLFPKLTIGQHAWLVNWWESLCDQVGLSVLLFSCMHDLLFSHVA